MLLIKNIGVLQTPMGKTALSGEKQGENLVLKNAAVLIDNGVIMEVTSDGKLPQVPEGANVREIDAHGQLVTPGLVDCHTHLVFGGWRQNEIPLKLKGASYLDILRAGGGILDTVKKTRTATEQELFDKSYLFLNEMLSFGVTTTEAKSGYGLNEADELKQLRVIKLLNENQAVDIVPTFMGAHAVPDEFKGNADGYVDYLCNELLPKVAELGLAEFCDVFCEYSVFDVSQSKKILEAAKKLGFKLKIHADEIEEIGGATLAGELSATSAEHLIATGEKGMKAMKDGNVIAALLPATSFYLNKEFAQARKMIEMGIPVALASDFNPGSCPSLNLQLVITLGYLKYRMTPEEILTAVTLNSACAIGRGENVGTIEAGKQADLVIWSAPDFSMLCYRMGSNLVKTVIKKGKVVHGIG